MAMVPTCAARAMPGLSSILDRLERCHQGGWARHDFSLAWLVAEGNLSEGGLAQLIGSGFKKGCALLYYSATEFESTLTVTGTGNELPGYTVQTLSSGSFF
jgi:hypothetical protein